MDVRRTAALIAIAASMSINEASKAVKSFELAVSEPDDVKSSHFATRNKSDRKRNRANRWR